MVPLPLLVKKTIGGQGSQPVCAARDIPNESLVIDPETNAIANVVIWLVKKPSQIHPDLDGTQSNGELIFTTRRAVASFLTFCSSSQSQRVRVLSRATPRSPATHILIRRRMQNKTSWSRRTIAREHCCLR